MAPTNEQSLKHNLRVAVAGVTALASTFFGTGCSQQKSTATPTPVNPTPAAQLASATPVTVETSYISPAQRYASETCGLGMIDSATTALLVKLNNGERGLVYNDPSSDEGRIIQGLLNSHRDITKHKVLPLNGAGTHSTFDAFAKYAFPRMGAKQVVHYPGAEIGKVAVTRMVLDSLIKNETDPQKLQLAKDLNYLLDMTIDGKSTFGKQGYTAGTKAAEEYGKHVAVLWRVLNSCDFVPGQIDTNIPVPLWGPGTTKRLEEVKTALGLNPNGTYIDREFTLRVTAALVGQPNNLFYFQKQADSKFANAKVEPD